MAFVDSRTTSQRRKKEGIKEEQSTGSRHYLKKLWERSKKKNTYRLKLGEEKAKALYGRGENIKYRDIG